MGLVGGPHCVAMCSAACAGVTRGDTSAQGHSRLLTFQIGRVVGYALIGAIAAGSIQGAAWMAENSQMLRPVWTMFHVALVMLGVALVWLGRQPYWLDGWGQSVWRRARAWALPLGRSAPASVGVLWALLPCGLLYSALMVAALTANGLMGAGVMAAFALGSGISMTAGAWWFQRMGAAAPGNWAIRLAGLALIATSGWALWMGITQPTGLFCEVPAGG
ncbi:MAG: hypothetical protein RL357_1341 [Pseudomonadota bacterium]